MLQRLVAAALIAGLLLSAPLWTASRLYPLTPVLPFWPAAGLDGVFYAGLLAAAAGVVVMPGLRAWTAAALACAVLLALGDWSRWQPWFYQYCVMLAVLAFSRRPAGACRIIVACIYFWSGLQKFNPNFRHDTLPWLLEPLGGAI